MESVYVSAWRALWPIARWFVLRKDRRRCVDAAATAERFGRHQKPSHWDSHSSAQPWTLWIHGASVGECVSALPLVEFALSPRFRSPQNRPKRVVISTTTPAARQLIRRRLSQSDATALDAVCVFAPLDAPASVARFYDTWQPDAGVWIESELWPTLILEASRRRIPIGLVNGRMSERSAFFWSLPLVAPFTRRMVAKFSLVLCQDEPNRARFLRLGAQHAAIATNLKFATPGQPSDARERELLQQSIGDRPVWLAASTHQGEELILAHVHARLATVRATRPLLVIIPRHPERAIAIIDRLRLELPTLTVSRRTGERYPTPATDIFVVDTLGEPSLFFDVVPTVVIGGTFVPRGGHNPIEPLRSGCHVLVGPHTFNFLDIIGQLHQRDATLVTQVPTADGLEQQLVQRLEQRPRHEVATRSLLRDLSIQALSTYEHALVQWLTTPSKPSKVTTDA